MPDKPRTVTQKKNDTLEIELRESRLQELIAERNGLVEDAILSRSEWENKITENYQRRKGMLARPASHLPFKGAADIRFPLQEKWLDIIKAVFFQSVIDAPHIGRFIPLEPGKFPNAQNVELYMDYTFAKDPLWRRTLSALIDQALEQGKCIAKITWDYRCEPVTRIVTREEARTTLQTLEQAKNALAVKTGLPPQPLTDDEIREAAALAFRYDLDNPIHRKRADSIVEQIRDDKPFIEVIEDKIVANQARVGCMAEITDFIVPPDTTTIQDAEWVAHDMLYSTRQLRADAVERGGKYRHVEELIEHRTQYQKNQNSLRTTQETKEGISETESNDTIRVRELYCWLPVKYIKRMRGKVYGGDDTLVRAVITYCPDALDLPPLRVMELPYNHNQWPFEEFTYRFGRLRFYDAKGLIERTEAMQDEYNICRNSAINRHVITLSPPVLVHSAAKINPGSFRQVGQVFKTNIPPSEAVHIPQWPDLSQGFEWDANQVENFGTELLGIPDLRLRQYTDAPTAAQVNQVQAPASALLRYDLEHFHDFIGRILRQVFELQKQFLFNDDREQIEYINLANPEETRQITPADYQVQYIIQSGGDMQRLDNLTANQMMFIAYQAAMNQPQLAPLVRPYDVNHYFFNKVLGPVAARSWLRPREEAAEYEQQFLQLQAQAAAMMQEKGKNPRNMKFKQIPNAQSGIVPQ